MPWFDDLPIIQKPHRACDGTGLIQGQPDPICNGTGLEDAWDGQPDQTEFPVKYTLVQVLDVLTKLDTLETKINEIAVQVQALYDDLNP